MFVLNPDGTSTYHVQGYSTVTFPPQTTPPAEAATIHRCPTFYVESRGWSQEVDTIHIELCDDPARRFKAVGKRTPLCPDNYKLEVYGSTPDEAVENFRKHLLSCKWGDYFSGIMKRIDNMQATINNLQGEIDTRNDAENATETRQPLSSGPAAPSSPTGP